MNKKIIAIAIATAMTAPVAMADIKISGRFAGHLVQSDKNATGTSADATKADRSFGESGASRLVFDGTSGKAFARIAYIAGNTPAGIDKSRDFFLGYKLGAGKISLGRIGGVAKNIEKDPLITTFLQLRKTNAEAVTSNAFGSSGFVNDVIQFAGKAGGMKYKIQYNPQDNTNRGTTGHLGLSVVGKAGPVAYFLSHNNGSGTKNTAAATVKESNTKLGASMKFGAAKVTLMNTGSDKEGAKKSANVLTANVGMGNGLAVNLGFSTGKIGTVKNTWNRLAVTKKINKGFMVYGGLTSSKKDGGNAINKTGVGAIIKF